jgi:long-chain acyl-CoA synthetase
MNLSFCNNLPELFFENCKHKHNKQHLIFINKETSKKEFLQLAANRKRGFGFIKYLAFDQKVQKGDRVMLVSENRPEWLNFRCCYNDNGAITVPKLHHLCH